MHQGPGVGSLIRVVRSHAACYSIRKPSSWRGVTRLQSPSRVGYPFILGQCEMDRTTSPLYSVWVACSRQHSA